MTGNSTTNIVLDTSVVAKSITTPPKHLPKNIYERELETRGKIHVILDILRENSFKVFYPKSGIVEAASVLKRSGMMKEQIQNILESLHNTFIIIDENKIYGKALEIALLTAPSGFDTYFLALALLTGSLLITDDKGMASHAEKLNINHILVRKTPTKEIRTKLQP